MKNPIGKAFQIDRMKNVPYLGFVITDNVNHVRYEVVDEPWVSILEAARTGGTGREPQYADVEVAFLGGEAPNKSYIPGLENMLQFTTYEELTNYLYNTDFKAHQLTIHFAGTIPDMWIYTDRLVGCSRLNLNFAGVPVPGASDGVFNLTDATACVFPCTGIRLYGPVKIYVNGSVIVRPSAESAVGGFGNIFYHENSYVIYQKLQMLVEEGTYTQSTASYPALFLSGMGAKVEFKERLIIGFGHKNGGAAKRHLLGNIMMALNYSYILVDSECATTIRNFDKTNVWTIEKPPYYAARYAMVRLRPVSGGGYMGTFALTGSNAGCHAASNGIVDTSARFSEILNGSGIKTSKVSSGGQVIFG